MKTQTRIGLAVGLIVALTLGLAPRAGAAVATGGDATNDIGGYRIHAFTNVGTSQFKVSIGGNVEVLVVAGGGGGGKFGGGGGAGGLITNSSFAVDSGSNYWVTVGDGGGGSATGRGTNGQSSVFGSLTAYGGGGGGARDNGTPERTGSDGGSGGGASPADGAPYGTGGLATNGQGKAGGLGGQSGWGGGGGGGAGQLGSNAVGHVAGRGGDGLLVGTSGSNVWYAGGGGGCTYRDGSATGGDGGAGGGGKGGKNANGFDGKPNTGGGGGGGDTGGTPYRGGKGGSGIVIVRYSLESTFIQNQPISGLTTNSVQLIATLNGASADIYAFWDTQDRGTNFTWAFTNSPLTAFQNTAAGTTITNTATGLTPGTSYSYRFYGTNTTSGWSGWSSAGSFVTPGPPIVDNTNGVTGLGIGTATLNGRVTLTNGAVCYGKFFWGPTDGSNNPTAWAYTNDIAGAVTQGVAYAVTLSNLLYGQQYYYRAAASNSYGLGWATNSVGFRTASPAGDLFLPSRLPGLQVWLDANSAGTLWQDTGGTTPAGNGDPIGRWDDKSGNAQHVTQSDAAQRPSRSLTSFNGRPSVVFNYAEIDLLDRSSSTMHSQSNLFYAAAFQMTHTDPWMPVCGVWNSDEVGDNPNGNLILQRMNVDSQIGCHNSGVADTRIKVNVATLSAERIGTLGRNGGTSGNGGTVTVSADDQATTDTQSWTTTEATSRIQIGGRQQSGNYRFGGDISEVVMFNRNLSTDERYQIDGYLAHKWGLESTLPTAHPYRNGAPGAGAAIAISNLTASGGTSTSAVLNATLQGTGSVFTVSAYYWVSGAGSSNVVDVGTYTNVASTNLSVTATNLTPGMNYAYTFLASNAATNLWATPAVSFGTVDVNVQATDPTGRVTLADTAAFTVYRPATATNGDLTVNYTLGGTATNGTHYTTSPAATGTNGTVTIPAGQTNAVITVYPLNATAPEQTVVLKLESGGYVIGAPNAATCTLFAATAWPVGADRYWVSATPGNWNNTANWSFAPSAPGGWSVPGSTNVAIFDGGGAGNCAIDANVNVAGLKVNSGYAGTVTQGAGRTVTVGASNYVQNAGTFAGGDTNIVVGGLFTLAGGTFTSTSGKLAVGRVFSSSDFREFFVVTNSATFAHNNGTVELNPQQNGDWDYADLTTYVRIPSAVTFKNLIVNAPPGGRNNGDLTWVTNLAGVATTVLGDFTHADGALALSIDVSGNFIIGANADGGSGTVRLNGSGDQTYSYTGGAGVGILAVEKSAGVVSPAAGTANLKADRFALLAGTFNAPTGTLSVGKEQEFANATIFSVSNTAAFVHNDGTVNFIPKRHEGWDGPGVTLSLDTPAGFTLNHLIVNARQDGRSDEIMTRLASASGHAIDVLGNLTHTDGILDVPLRVRRDVTIAATADGGTGTVALAGALDQTLARQSAGSPAGGTWTIDKSGGAATLATDFPLTSTGQQLVWTNGALNLSSNTLTVAGAVTIYPGATTLGVKVVDATKAGRLTCSNTVSGITNVTLAMAISATEGQMSGQIYTILTNTTSFGSATFESVTWPGLWVGDVSYATSAGRVVTVSNIRQAAAGDAPLIQNRPATNVTTGGAAFNGKLVSNGTYSATVFVLWGETNGAVSGSWASTNSWNQGDWPDGSYPSTNLTLAGSRNYYYTFGAVNLGGQTIYPDAQYLITGELTVQAIDPTGRVTLADNAAFTVARPASCTNEDLAVNYALGGTAANGTDYTIAPVSGAVVIARGQTNGVITVTPVYKQSLEQTVILTLLPGTYAVGAQNSATCTLAAVVGTNRYWVASTEGNWSAPGNWSFASGGPGGYSVPGAGSLATFDGNGPGNCLIDANASVAGLLLGGGYSGTVTQGLGRTLAIGQSNYVQYAGVFAGGNTNIAIDGTFTLAGGTFTSTAGSLTMGRQADNETIFSVAPGATFSHNNGTVAFSPRQNGDGSDVFTVDVDGSLILNHIIVNGRPGGHNDLYSCQITPASGDALTAAGNFTHTDGLLLGTWDVRGNLSVGSLADEGSGTLTLNGAGDQTYAYTSGAGAGRLVIDKAASSVSPAAGVGSLRCAALIVRAGTFHAPTGTLSVGKEQEFADATIFSVSNTAAFVHNDGTVNFIPKRHEGWDGPGVMLSLDTPAGFTLNHLIVNARQDGRSDEIMTRLASASGHAIDVLGNLTHTDGILDVPLRVRRDVTIAATADGGTGTVALAGALDQTLTRQTNGSPAGGTWTIDKSGGTVTLATDVPLTSTGQQLVWTNGALDLSSNTLTVAGAVTIYPGATTLGVTVADTNKAGRLTCSNTVSGITNVTLAMAISATEGQMSGQTYVILTNTAVLAAPFESVTWLGGWKGVVAYTDNGGKNVTLSSIAKEQGSVFKFR